MEKKKIKKRSGMMYTTSFRRPLLGGKELYRVWVRGIRGEEKKKIKKIISHSVDTRINETADILLLLSLSSPFASSLLSYGRNVRSSQPCH